MTDFNKIFPEWSFRVDKASNGIHRFAVVNSTGRRIELSDSDYNKGLLDLKNKVFDFELENNRTVNKFIYSTFLSLLDDGLIKEKKYEQDFFGSWIIKCKNKRIVFYGEESVLSLEKKTGVILTNWVELKTLNIRDKFVYEDIVILINEMSESYLVNA